jgi:cephalosporin hydroxylase
MNQVQQFENEKEQRIAGYTPDTIGVETGRKFTMDSCFNGYTYNFSWMGLPIIQFPQDIVMMQEILYSYQPDVLIETGVARGGSLVFYASIMELIGKGKVVGVDIEIRPHNREAIENHSMSKRIHLVEGSSTAPEVIKSVQVIVGDAKKVIVCLDSKHTHDHVLEELRLYKNFVSSGSYLVVFDTTVENFDADVVEKLAPDYRFKPWGKGSNPHSAIQVFLGEEKNFHIEDKWHKKTMITNCWEGVLRKD